MAATNAATTDEMAAKAVNKRYEGLAMVRTKATKGKGAWYWAHLEPILVTNSDTGLPKAVKLRCSLCDAVFSASNPSRTASEHLKRGTCPNFASSPNPISSMPPSSSATAPHASFNVSPLSSQPPHNHRKRGSSSGGTGTTFPPHHVVPPSTIVDPSRFTAVVSVASVASPAVGGGGLYGHQHHHHQQQQQQLMLSGGKEDLGALAMLEDSVKRLKSPKASPRPALSKDQVESALDSLADWVYECCGSVSLSSLDHPKFKDFLSQVGLPPISKREFAASRLDAKYEEAKAECEAKIHDAIFFQIASYGLARDENLVHLAVNLSNGTSVFRRAVFTSDEEILWDSITDTCGSNLQQCVGIVSDKFKAKALKNLENQHPWMVNLCCQYKGFTTLIKDFGKELPLFKNVATNCLKLASLVNSKSQIRHSFQKYRLQEYGHGGLLRAPCRGHEYTLVDDILSSARALHLLLSDESYKLLSVEEEVAREVEEMMRNPHFWNELEAVHSLVKLIKTMARGIETEKPRIGQCLPLWEELRGKVKDWCSKLHILEGSAEKVIERRFEKNYHPSWAAAFILDPLYLIRDASGKYLPPFKCLSPDQERDVEKMITRLAPREEAHIALMELMKWRTEGLDPVYAQAVQLRQKDPNTGKLRIANPQSSRLVWEAHLTELKSLGKVAVRLIFLHATSSCGYKCNWSLQRWVGTGHSLSRVGMDRAQKLMFIAAHSKMEKRELAGDGNDDDDDDDETELFALANGEEDVLNDVFVDTSSV